jgi:hypothetical protein
VGRSNRPRGAKKREAEPQLEVNLLRVGIRRTENRRGIDYTVQSTNGRSEDATKTWICPNCNVTITQSTNHLVVWDEGLGVHTRRHFHTNCWKSFTGILG